MSYIFLHIEFRGYNMKKIIIIPIILILFLSFSAVRASDEYNSTDNHTFEAIQNAVEHEDVIELDGMYEGSGHAVIVNKSVTIKASDSGATLDAKSSSQIFRITSNDVVLDGLTFINGNPKQMDSRNYGGAVYVDADNVKIINCVFVSNSAEYGGAIAAMGRNVSIIDCEFISNYATYSGGAFELDGDDNYVGNCKFTDNTGGHVGGAVAWVGANGILANSTFSNANVASSKICQYGGAVVWMGANGTLTKSSFSKFQSKKSGAAIYWRGDKGSLSYCEFKENYSPNDLAYYGNPDYANHNYWGLNINSTENFIAQKLIYFNQAFQSPASWINPCTITCSNLVTYNVINAKNGKYFKMTLKDSNNNPIGSKSIIFKLNGKEYNATTDKNGVASFQVNLKNPGKYKVSVTFNGDDEYWKTSKTAKITVNKQKPTLTVSTKTLKLKTKNKVIKLYLKDQFKKPISKKTVKITINKKTYTARTNSKGLASFKVTLKAKKNYSCTVKFAGDKYYNSVSKSAKIRVK